jgi:hypothetical protein
VSFVGLPLGHEGSGLVLLSTPSIGRLWWSARSGMFPILLNVEPKVELASGDADLTAKAAGSLWRACVAGERRGLADVESRCFDGISATVALHGCGGDRVKATCNVAEAGREPALVLARRLVAEMGKHRVFGWGACG